MLGAVVLRARTATASYRLLHTHANPALDRRLDQKLNDSRAAFRRRPDRIHDTSHKPQRGAQKRSDSRAATPRVLALKDARPAPCARASVVHHLHELDGPLLVEGHDLGDESLEVEDGLAAQLQAVLVEGRALQHRRLEAVVHLLEQLESQALPPTPSHPCGGARCRRCESGRLRWSACLG